MFLARNLLPMVRADTTRTGAITRVDAFGVLGRAVQRSRCGCSRTPASRTTTRSTCSSRSATPTAGRARVSYSLSKSRGTADDQADRNTDQFLTDLNLDDAEGPTLVDRRHVLSMGGRIEMPKTDGRDAGGDDALHDRLAVHDLQQQHRRRTRTASSTTRCRPAPTAARRSNALQDVENDGGRNGAYGPDYFQVDLRAGWRARIGEQARGRGVPRRLQPDQPHQLRQPVRRRAAASTFLVLTNLRGGSGFPRQVQFGVRYMF